MLLAVEFLLNLKMYLGRKVTTSLFLNGMKGKLCNEVANSSKGTRSETASRIFIVFYRSPLTKIIDSVLLLLVRTGDE